MEIQKQSEYRKNIARIKNIPEESVGNFDKVSWLEKGEKGTKSDVYSIVIKTPGAKSDPHILKVYNREAIDLSGNKSIYESYIDEKAMLTTALRYEKVREIFPALQSDDDPFFDSNCALLVKEVEMRTLEQILVSNSTSKVNPILKSLETAAKFKNFGMKYVNDIEAEIKKCSNGVYEKIEKKTPELYAYSFAKHMGIVSPKSNRLNAQMLFLDSARKYFDFDSFILNDFYSFNISPDRFIDVGEPKIGPQALMLGCLLGYPTVFNILKKESISMDYLVNHFTERCQDYMDKDKLLKGTLLGGIYGNIRCAAGIKTRHPEDKDTIKELISIAVVQAENLYDKDKTSHRLFSLLNNMEAK